MAELEIKNIAQISSMLSQKRIDNDDVGLLRLLKTKWVSLDSLQKRDALKREQLIEKLDLSNCGCGMGLTVLCENCQTVKIIEEVLADEVDEGTSSLLGSGTEHKGEGR